MNVNGLPVTGPTYFDWNEMCEELLGKVPINEENMRGCELKARILYIIGGELLPDKSNNRVHLMYLPLHRDLSRIHRYSWGSTCLANLYMEMCRTTKPNAKAMGGCLMLLQSWAWYRLPFLAPRFDGLPSYPFAKSLNGSHMRLITTISHVKSNKIRSFDLILHCRMASNRSSKTTIWINPRFTTTTKKS
ncbi:hypothetical protein Lal_00018831 [Lupinus albus]|nr:hypothetical protein Lal_00018831 [Lupinus albus]